MKRTFAFVTSGLLLLLASLVLPTALQAQKSVISGRLLGYDQKPIVQSDVHLLPAQGRMPIASVSTDKDGNYRLETDARGYFNLQFTGAHHQMSDANVLLGEPRSIGIDATLATNGYPDSFDGITVIGDFNDWDLGNGTPMTKQRNGTYTVELSSKEKTLRYQVVVQLKQPGGALASRSFNGTMSTSFEYDGGGDYRSVVPVKGGKVTIVFDPKRIVSSETPAKITINDPATQRLQSLLERINSRRGRYYDAMRAMMARGEDASALKYIDSTIGDLAAEIRNERDPETRSELYFEYLVAGANGSSLDSTLAQQALAEIPATSSLWSINPSGIVEGVDATGERARFLPYARTAAFAHPDTAVRIEVLTGMVANSYYKGDTVTLREYYTVLVKEYPNNYSTQHAANSYSPDRAIQVGRHIPHFNVASLEDPSVNYSDESMKGKVYLIDFWATWCGPCIGEMGNLHAAYEKYHGRNFEIVSLSFDGEPTIIGRFRSKKWKMPWLHTFVNGGFKSELARLFEVSGIPKPILVSEDGTILATSEDLRGANLGKTLARIFDQPN